MKSVSIECISKSGPFRKSISSNIMTSGVSCGQLPEQQQQQQQQHQQQQEQQQKNNNDSEQRTECKKSHSSNKLLGAQSCSGSTRKLSTKEKCRRQKDAERVEKLRLLVSYLRSGSSQPVVSPVALEADEIELAERYKLHMSLRDDLLNDLPTVATNQSSSLSIDGGQQKKQPCSTSGHHHHHDETRAISSVAGNSSPSNSSCSMNHRSSIGVVNFGAESSSDRHHHVGGLIGVANNNSANTAFDATRSIPHIGQVSWMLRHSISDPGDKFGHNFNCNTGNHSSGATSGARSSTASALSTNQSQQESCGQFSTKMSAVSVGHVAQRSCVPAFFSHHQRANSCKASSSYYAKNNNNNNNNHDSSSSSSNFHQQHQQHQLDQQPIRLFYIDDLDAPQAHLFHHSVSPKSVIKGNLVPNISNTNIPNDSVATMMTQASSSGNFTSDSACCSHATISPPTTQDNTSMRSSKSCSAWTNPQNLATWIDNEVNSLVHDLEVNESRQKHTNQNHKLTSQQKQQQQQNHGDKSSSNGSCKNKEGKRKWLSVTSGNIRRISSGAHST